MTTDTRSALEIVGAIYAGMMQGDLASVEHLVDERFVGLEADALPYAGRYEGLSGFRGLAQALGDAWDDPQADNIEFVVDGDRVVALLTLRATSRATGLKLEMPLAELWRVANGKAVLVQPFYFDTHEVRRVCGL